MSRVSATDRMQRVLILGLGMTGRALVRYCLAHGIIPFVSDAGFLPNEAKDWLHRESVRFEDAGHSGRFLADVDGLLLSPGVPIGHPVVLDARERGLPVLSELEWAASLSPHGRLVAVTGTNGKSSTVTLIGSLLEFAGLRIRVAGNIGLPFVSILDDLPLYDVVVLEVSSYQLEQCASFRPDVGVLLNLAVDHLSRHGSMTAYADAKGMLFRHQAPDDLAVLPYALRRQFMQGRGKRVFFDHPWPPFPDGASELSAHERQNLAAAIVACVQLVPSFDARRISSRLIRSALALPHRMEKIGTVDGVTVVNDSKSTNAASSIAALRAIDGPIVLLLGGRSKGAGYEVLAQELSANRVRQIIVFGEAAGELSTLLTQAGVFSWSVSDLEAAVRAGLRAAVPGDTLLLSPACASFDQFRDFAERGERFVQIISACSRFLPQSDKEAEP